MHLLLLGLLVSHGERLWSRPLAPGDAALRGGSGSKGGSGGGGNRVAYITLPSAPAPVRKVVKTPQPVRVSKPEQLVKPEAVPRPDPVEVAAEQPAVADTATRSQSETPAAGSTAAGMGGAGAGGEGRGGLGRGSGSDSGSGAGAGRARPPEPRDMAFPFDNPPKELRGVSLSVTFWVSVDGRVERYQVNPEIKDREYAKKFDDVMRAFRFTPARAPDGTPIAGTTKISFTLPGKSSS